MEKINIIGNKKKSEVYLDGTFDLLDKLVNKENTIVLTDENILKLYSKDLDGFRKIVLQPGEQNKTLETYQKIINSLIEHQANRRTTLLAVGGGVICDLCGFVASTYMRGMDFGYVSTTILSQVDASIGGKNGLNYDGAKNIIGIINQPRFVICDYEMLKSLPKDEILNGFGEIIKHVLLEGSINIDDLINYPTKYLEWNNELKGLISHSIKFKASIVKQDENDTGIRNILNFGHTFGHAIEAISQTKHGFAVSIGIAISARISVKMGLLSSSEYDKIIMLLDSFGLPSTTDQEYAKLFEKIKRDKKRIKNGINFVLLNGIGNPVIKELTFSEIKTFLED